MLGIALTSIAAETLPAEEDWLEDDFKIPVWYKTFNLKGGFGYKDNVLLSYTNSQDSAFWRSGLEMLILRLPTRGWNFSFYLTADDVRYFDTSAVDNEQVVMAMAQVQKELGKQWKTGVGVNYMFQNQVFDLSASYDDSAIGKVLGHGLTGRWMLRKDFEANWLEAELSVLRQLLDAPLDDYWQIGPRFVAGRKLSSRAELTLSYQWAKLPYDSRVQLDREGREVAGTSLAFQSHNFDFTWRHQWDEQKHWQTSVGVGADINQDNGSGYFNYLTYRLTTQIKYQTESWGIHGRCRLGYYEYGTQTVSLDDPAKRHKTLISVNLRAERKLSKAFKIFADYYYDRSLSNLVFDDYGANSLSAGVDWEF